MISKIEKNVDQKIAEPATNYPSVVRSNSRLTNGIIWLCGFGLVLPFLLPESDWLAKSFIFQQLGVLIPSAHKLSIIASSPNVVFVYLVAMLAFAFLCGTASFLSIESQLEYLQFAVLGEPRGKWVLWLKGFLGIFVFAALLAFFYIFPDQPTNKAHGSRGQLMVSFMVSTKPGLAIVGASAAAGAATIWFVWCQAIFNFFSIPFQYLFKR
ncbi:hypothetical protein [Roseateles oligotrophus]|uniref:Uncharacterized protein n=1 Tax=Roseateles oligotrophus TaxID=1769250 RepID=A0ABT2YEV7_9BURK|nr:hypothetical protein [Roseateles oligotrophus]MCV2368588.1 hypothetical protein [Roseateles oligotrophus]